MKKVIYILITTILIIGLTGCRFTEREPNYESSDLEYLIYSKSEEKQNYLNSPEYLNFIKQIGYFSTDLTEKVYNKYQTKYDQFTISPLSIYMALAMGAASASPDGQIELSEMLGISYEDILEYTKYLYSSLNQSYYDEYNKLMYMIQLSNSIWLNDSLDYKEQGVQTLRDAFYVDSYSVPFTTKNEEANKAVQDYVRRNTKGLIDNEYSFDAYTLFLLINTLYLKDTWNSYGDELSLTPKTYSFKNINGTTKDSKLLMGNYVSGQAKQADGFEYFYTRTNHNLQLYFIKPTTKSLDEIFTKENLALVLEDKNYNYINDELKEEYYTRCLFPTFEASFNEDLVDLLKDEYGITSIFKSQSANFNQITAEECYTSQLIHQTKLIVDETGIEGAAVTIMVNGAESEPDPSYQKVFYDFIIDQGFGFMIVKNNTILFSGAIKNI